MRQQVVEVAFAHGLAAANRGVQHRLRERRLVTFVVAQLAIGVHVDHDIRVELGTEVDRQAHNLRHGLRIFAIHVEDRDLQHLGHIRAVGRAATILRVRGEANLVVDDHMDRAARLVRIQLREVERLLHDALAAKGRIAVDQHRHALRAVRVTQTLHVRAHAALGHCVHEL